MKKIISSRERQSDLDNILTNELIIKKIVKSEIIFSEPILTLKEQSFIFPNTLNFIQGKSGSHKSRLCEHVCSTLLKKPGYSIDLLQLESISKEHLVCYVDTERNIKEQFPYSMQQIIINAGYKIQDDIDNFNYISLIHIERSHRFTAFKDYIKRIRETYHSHIFCVLDVITDLLNNFNDPNDSLELIDLLNRVINSYDTTFLCVIHENPGPGFKPRGHVGTELSNKGSTALSVNFENNKTINGQAIIKISFPKSRSTRRIEDFYAKYSSENNRLECVDPLEIENLSTSKNLKAHVLEVAYYLIKNLKKRTSKSNLFNNLSSNFQCDPRTIEERIKEIINCEILEELGYRLRKEKFGKEVFFELERVDSENKQGKLFVQKGLEEDDETT